MPNRNVLVSHRWDDCALRVRRIAPRRVRAGPENPPENVARDLGPMPILAAQLNPSEFSGCAALMVPHHPAAGIFLQALESVPWHQADLSLGIGVSIHRPAIEAFSPMAMPAWMVAVSRVGQGGT